MEKKKEIYEPSHTIYVVISITLFILSALPLFIIQFITGEENQAIVMAGVSMILFMVASGIFLLVSSTVKKESYDKLLEEDDYTREKKGANKKNELVSRIYWMAILAVYLIISFVYNARHI